MPAQSERTVSAEELCRLIQQGDAPPVIDVRSGLEYRRGHIPGAVHLPFWLAWRGLPTASRGGAHGTRSSSERQAPILYCGRGPRAVIARWLLPWSGTGAPTLLRGHMREWMRRGLPRER